MGLIEQWIACYGPNQISGSPLPKSGDAEPSTQFRQRVAMAVSAQAVAVSQELTSVTNHANREALAKDVLNNPAKYVFPFAQAMASQGLTNDSTDQQITNAVSVGWNYMAGVP